MALRPVQYECGCVGLTGWLADGSRGRPAPGVLVAHEAYGVSDHVKRRAEMLAERGYVAFAYDLYGRSGSSIPEAQAMHREMMETPGLLRARAEAGLETLGSQANVDTGRLAMIGFCQGGVAAMELARCGAPLRAAIGFHPGLQRCAGSADGPIGAKVLMMIGDADPVVPPDSVAAFAAEMRASGADWQLHLFGGVGHSFTNPAVDAFGYAGFAYDERADRRAWAMAIDLLEEVFAV